MARTVRGRASWKRAGSSSGRKAPRKAHPRTHNNYNRWTASDVRALRQLAKQNTPMRVIGQKLGRTPISIRGKAQREGISLRPTNQTSISRQRAR
jgi:hypothetical protein